MRTLLTACILSALISPAFAGDVRVGVAAQVKPNSIWFENAADLTRWQALKARGNAKAAAAFQDQRLRRREAWQFLSPLDVKILAYRPKTHQVEVEMTTAGRMQGTTWRLDSEALVK